MIKSTKSQRKCAITLMGLVVTCFAVSSGCRRDPDAKQHVPAPLRIWQTETDAQAIKRLNETIAEFRKAYPGVEVQLESVAWSSLSSKLAAAIQSNNEPDLAHLEPFMVASLVFKDLLLPIDDVINDIETESQDQIFPSIKDLQLFDGKRYGIAYAVGTTGFAYRKDWATRLSLREPETWDQYIEFAKTIYEASNGKLKVLLPGGDPFFIDQLFAELIADNGGKLFDTSTNRPLLTSKPAVETLNFFSRLAPYVDSTWQTQNYLDQFNRLARGEAGNVPVTYARATKAIESALKDSQDPSLAADPEHFGWMPQPVGPSYNGPSISTIDCEPYCVFKSAKGRQDVGSKDKDNAELAKEFLRMFYRADLYMSFVRTVPIHLTPIFQGMAASADYNGLELISRWRPWANQTTALLSDPKRVRPILMPDDTEQGRALPFLLEFQASRILTQAVSDVVKNHLPAQQAAENAQKRAEQFLESINQKKW
jgi:ABC-type glycerol-3-phosphate transport system substrate-binding protein